MVAQDLAGLPCICCLAPVQQQAEWPLAKAAGCAGKCLGLLLPVLSAGPCLFCFGGARLTLAASCSSQDVGLTLESASLVIQ